MSEVPIRCGTKAGDDTVSVYVYGSGSVSGSGTRL